MNIAEPTILLSFDVEEFDLPLEYNGVIDTKTQMNIGYEGLMALGPLLSDAELLVTLFTTAHFANHFATAIKNAAAIHEIASHAYYHSTFKIEDLLASRMQLENISGQSVTGLRMPRMKPVDMAAVLAAGYTYDSSLNPTWIPGRYNNLKLPRQPYIENNITRIPLSVTPNLRLPLFWLAFKNMPYVTYLKLMRKTLQHDGYLCLYFHPWEFTTLINSYNIPFYTKKYCGSMLLDRLYQLITDLRKEAIFSTMKTFEDTYFKQKRLLQ